MSLDKIGNSQGVPEAHMVTATGYRQSHTDQAEGSSVGNCRHSQRLVGWAGLMAVAYLWPVNLSIIPRYLHIRHGASWFTIEGTQFLGILTVTQFTERDTEVLRGSMPCSRSHSCLQRWHSNIYLYVFVWLHQVLAAAHTNSDLHCGMQDI